MDTQDTDGEVEDGAPAVCRAPDRDWVARAQGVPTWASLDRTYASMCDCSTFHDWTMLRAPYRYMSGREWRESCVNRCGGPNRALKLQV